LPEAVVLPLLPEPTLRLDRIEITDQAVTLCLLSTAAILPCPLCALPATDAHSRYTRQVRDLPIQGRPTTLRLTVRRFFCRNPACSQRIFCEQLPQLLSKHARCTTRLTGTQRDLGLAVGGEPGSRLAAKLGMPTSPDTLLRRVKAPPVQAEADPPRRVVGIDDWAMRKGHTYGTIIIDLERSEVVELLPGRDGVQLKTWLAKHPEIEILARDRWVPYADAATEAAPQAKQVADRFHLFKNIRQALERFLDRYTKEIHAAFPDPVAVVTPQTPDPDVDQAALPVPASDLPAEPALSPVRQRPPSAKKQRRLERFEEVRRRHADGQSLRSISRAMHLSWTVVRRYVRSDHLPDWRPGRTGPSLADGYCERIDTWLGQGNRNVAELYRQLKDEGVALGYDTLRRFVTRRLAVCGQQRQSVKLKRRRRYDAAQPRPRPPPSTRTLSFAVIVRPDERTEKQQGRVNRLRDIQAEIAEAVGLVEEFALLLRKQSQTTLTDWYEKALNSTSKELRRFAQGLEQDWAAVQGAVDERWSTGPVEGQVGRLKGIKRSMFGRASLPLLRARVLHVG
jgi:transposase